MFGVKCFCKEGEEFDRDGKSCKGKLGFVMCEIRKMINCMFVIIILIIYNIVIRKKFVVSLFVV